MSNVPAKQNKLPKISDLTLDSDQAYKNDELNRFLNHEPKSEWIKTHPYVKNHKYIPVSIIEMLLKMIFKQYKIEITGQGSSFNGVWVTVRVHYLNPTNNEWAFHDGIGAIQLQMRGKTEEEKENNDQVPFVPENINNGALSMAYPHAKTLAIKDACDMFGKLFGADLNRRDTLAYQTDTDLANKANKQKIDSDGLETLIKNLKSGKIGLEKINEMYDLTMEQMKQLIEANNE